MNPRAAPDPEAGLRAPDAPERLRLVEDDLDELQWSDGARTTVAVQVSAALLASTWAAVGEPLRAPCLACGLVYASATCASRRQRRQPAAFVQVAVATAALVGFASLGAAARRAAWRAAAAALWLCEAFCWREATADLVEMAFARFQHGLFLTLIVATYWFMPLLYDFAERLEVDAAAASVPAAAPLLGDFGADAVRSRFAGALLYGGTALMLALSAAVWYRMYRLAPDLFRVFTLVIAAGGAAGATLFLAGAGDVRALSAATATAFAVMAHLALPHDGPRRSVAALAAGLYGAFAALDRGAFAAACVAVQVAVKCHALADLARLRGRPRTLARLDVHATCPGLGALVDAPLAATLLPAVAV